MQQKPVNTLSQQQMEAALRMARVTLDSAEKLLQLQIDTVKQAAEGTARHAARLAQAKDMEAAMAIRSEISEQTVSSLLELSRGVYELAMHTQAELLRQAESQLGAGPTAMLEGFATLAPLPGADVLTNAMKSTVAASQAAYDSMSKAAKQVAEFADASLKAANTATAAAVKTGSRRK